MKGKIPKILSVALALVLVLSFSLVTAVPVSAAEGTIELNADWYKTGDTVTVTIEDADLDVLQEATQDPGAPAPDGTVKVFQFVPTDIEFDSVSWPYDMSGEEYLIQSFSGELGQITLQAAPPGEAELMALTAYASLPGTIAQPTKATPLTVFLDATPAEATSVTITVTGTTEEVGEADTEAVIIDNAGPSTETGKHFSLITGVEKTDEVAAHGTTEVGIKVDNLIFADYTYYEVETFQGSVISSVEPTAVTPLMTETGPHTGIFKGTLILDVATDDTEPVPALVVVDGGTITAEYDDADPVDTVTVSATVDDTAPSLISESPEADLKINDATPVISVDVLDFESGFEELAVLGMEIMDTTSQPGIVSPVQTEIANGYHLEYHVGTSEALSAGDITVNITGSDIAGNTLDDSWTFTVDLTAPTMVSATTATTTTIEVTFGEELDDATVAPADFLVDGTITPSKVAVDVAVVTLTVPEMATNATPTVALVGAVSDLAGNELTEPDDVTAADGVGPTVAIVVSPDPCGAGDATFTLTFSETMDTGVALTVTFTIKSGGPETVSGGWASYTTWQGTFDIETLTDQEFASVVTVIDGQDLLENVMEAGEGSFDIDTSVADPTFSPTGTIYTASPVVRITFTEEVTITAATFDDEDVLADLTTIDSKTYRLATLDLAEDEYTISVSAKDGLDNTGGPFTATFTVAGAVVTQNIDLYDGWNLISLPLIPDNSDITVVISSDTLASGDVSNVGIVRAYDPATGEFLPSYIPETGSGDLATMEDGYGYWVFMDAADTLTVTGRVMPAGLEVPPSYDVVEGWNLIGLKSLENRQDVIVTGEEITGYLANIAGTYPVLWSWDAEANVYSNVKGEADGMEVGHGFWLWATEPGTIIPTPKVGG